MVIAPADVLSAIENDAVIPYFQPLVELRSGQVYGLEMLARWRHADLGPILPANFIAIAEQSGLIWQMTWLLLRRAFRAATQFPCPPRLAVNIVRWYGTAEDISEYKREIESWRRLLNEMEMCHKQPGSLAYCHPEIVTHIG